MWKKVKNQVYGHQNIRSRYCRPMGYTRVQRITEYCAACGRRIGMRGYTAVPEDGRTCFNFCRTTALPYTTSDKL